MPFVAQPTPQTARDRRFNVAAAAKDGIQLIAISRVAVRTNIDRLVGGAGEETVIARVGEGMVSTIGSAATHKNVLENPDHISKHILSKGLEGHLTQRLFRQILGRIEPLAWEISARTSS